MSTTTAVIVSASTSDQAVARCAKHVAKVPGFEVTGRVAERSAKHLLWTVEVTGSGDVNDLWVVLTSFGMDPSPMGSVWEATLA